MNQRMADFVGVVIARFVWLGGFGCFVVHRIAVWGQSMWIAGSHEPLNMAIEACERAWRIFATLGTVWVRSGVNRHTSSMGTAPGRDKALCLQTKQPDQ